MKRRKLVVAAAASLGVSGAVWAQPVLGKVWRVGLLSEASSLNSLREFFSALAELGYVEGRNLVIDFKYSDVRKELLPALAAELIAARPDLLIAPGNLEAMALRRVTTTIPIVMLYAVAPVEAGLIASLASPGGNITGTTTSVPEMFGKMTQILRDSVPGAKQMLWFGGNLNNPTAALYVNSSLAAGAAMGLRISWKDVRTQADLDVALSALERDRPDVLAIATVGILYARFMQIVEHVARLRLPTLYSARAPVVQGGLIGFGPNFPAMAAQNARQIDKILRGAKPADIPVEEPARFRLSINMKAARALGLTIPQKVLLSADEVIE